MGGKRTNSDWVIGTFLIPLLLLLHFCFDTSHDTDCGDTSLSSSDTTELSKCSLKSLFKRDGAKQVPLVSIESNPFKVCSRLCVCVCVCECLGPLLRKRTVPPSPVKQQHRTLTATRWTTPASEPVWLSTIRTSTVAHVKTHKRTATRTHLSIALHGTKCSVNSTTNYSHSCQRVIPFLSSFLKPLVMYDVNTRWTDAHRCKMAPSRSSSPHFLHSCFHTFGMTSV